MVLQLQQIIFVGVTLLAARDCAEVPEERGCGPEAVEPHHSTQATGPPSSQGLVLQLLCQRPAWCLIPEVS